MIIFHGTKRIGIQRFLVFTNEAGKLHDIQVDEKTLSYFLHHFHRLSPGTVGVEENELDGKEEN